MLQTNLVGSYAYVLKTNDGLQIILGLIKNNADDYVIVHKIIFNLYIRIKTMKKL